MIRIKKVDNRPLTLLERLYFTEVAAGLMVTLRHFFRNLFRPSNIVTVGYPEERLPLPGNARLRTRHRLKQRADGTPRCVACYMCQTACPAYCIDITAGEYADGNPAEKYPRGFDIDLSRCVMCGMCVEACPEDAIAMDTGEIPGGALTREDLFMTKRDLLRSLPGQGAGASAGEPSAPGAANRLHDEWDRQVKKK